MAAEPSIKFALFGASHVDGVMGLLLNSFRVDEPLNRAVGLQVEDCEETLRTMFVKPAIGSPVSFVALDENKNNAVVGCRISTIKKRSDPSDDPRPLANDRYEPVLQLLESMEADLWDHVPASAKMLLKFELVSVDPSYRRLGIALKLIKYSIDAGRRHGCDHVTVVATSFKTQLLFETKMAFKTAVKRPIRDFEYKGGYPFQAVPEDNLNIMFMYKNIE